ncbi:hypothetical protein [Mycoplasma todarodis]|uniref:Uncharacterized protein n=1 Tax=Mycoplasma todarodis TaxID=1937191 RepID=A0A4R0XV22_9MOLU|nr:hypothetical protein [Mycoplasma todarodis]TCG11559.1 hypothetical protein C4B25_01095 [Mycoplasma todarodis]
MKMKKITTKVWVYATNFLIEAIMFNVALVFAIVALVFKDQGMGKWAITAIVTAAIWFAQLLFKHIIWSKMSKIERALFLAIRKHGKKIIDITSTEVTALGQSDIHEVLTDTDNGLEVQMIINGAGTFLNVFIGVKWFIYARQFHNNHSTFEYVTEQEETQE